MARSFIATSTLEPDSVTGNPFPSDTTRMHSPPRPTATSGTDECSRVLLDQHRHSWRRRHGNHLCRQCAGPRVG
ncbi:hypothetical protein EMIT0P44_140070 [Pseudomonas sp. IT-P44]